VERELGKLGPVLAAGVRGYVVELVERALLTAQFQELWRQATVQSHKALVASLEGQKSTLIQPDGSVEVNLASVVAAARDSLAATGLHVFDRVQPGLVQERFTIARPGALQRARHAVSVLRTLSIVLPVVAVALVGLAFALSRDRRRRLHSVALGFAGVPACGVVAGRLYYLHSVVGLTCARGSECLLRHRGATCVAPTRSPARGARRGARRRAGRALAAAVRLRSLTPAEPEPRPTPRSGESARRLGRREQRARCDRVVAAGLLFLITSGPLSWALLLEVAAGVAIALGGIEVLARPRSTQPQG
jgi:hypothetical protein